jgi:hypothetical protein
MKTLKEFLFTVTAIITFLTLICIVATILLPTLPKF